MDQDMVVLARVKLLSANRRVVRGVEGLWIYRLLTQVEPETYGSKLVYVLVETSASPLLRELPEQRAALLDEAVEVARSLDMSNPYRAKMLARALAARRRQTTEDHSPQPQPQPQPQPRPSEERRQQAALVEAPDERGVRDVVSG